MAISATASAGSFAASRSTKIGCEVAFVVQLPQEFAHEAGLAHAPLGGQQRVGSVPDPLSQILEFSLAVKEPVAVDPVGARFS